MSFKVRVKGGDFWGIVEDNVKVIVRFSTMRKACEIGEEFLEVAEQAYLNGKLEHRFTSHDIEIVGEGRVLTLDQAFVVLRSH